MGCAPGFIYNGADLKAGAVLKISCNKGEPGFNQGAGFVMEKGMSECHPISFVTKEQRGIFFWHQYSASEMNLILFISKLQINLTRNLETES
ncbi:hypothetical protein Patl1_29655 [Pistacia atlantica]|uniref:Uncharacterized protein n=1 Tax=Pistacia atlantica TaxID=434234 RepID=A0ACC1A980_9ROSI|nr:hypothetical protein Patl1_29655 [Pistacia atlantica]